VLGNNNKKSKLSRVTSLFMVSCGEANWNTKLRKILDKKLKATDPGSLKLNVI
jgi:hypothetical protein